MDSCKYIDYARHDYVHVNILSRLIHFKIDPNRLMTHRLLFKMELVRTVYIVEKRGHLYMLFQSVEMLPSCRDDSLINMRVRGFDNTI